MEPLQPVRTTPRRVWLYVILMFVGTMVLCALIVSAAFFFTLKYFADKNPAPTGPSEPSSTISYELPADAPVLGALEAPVTMIEFADFQCPFCKEFQDSIFPQLKRDYIDSGKIRFYYQNFAFLGDESLRAAEAARCAKNQGNFWQYHDALFAGQKGENEGTFSDQFLVTQAKLLGLEEKDFSDCLTAHLELPLVESETKNASDAGVLGTPTLSINGKALRGVPEYSAIQAAIEDALQNK